MSTAQGIKQFYQVAQQRGFVRDFQLRLKYWNVLNNRGSLDDNNFLLLTTATLPSTNSFKLGEYNPCWGSSLEQKFRTTCC